MPFATTATALKARSVPLIAATALSATLYAGYSQFRPPARLEDLLPVPDALQEAQQPPRKMKPVVLPTGDPYVPLGWGSNRYMTLFADSSLQQVKKPTPLGWIGGTPLRDMVIEEKYGVAVDARGDCWIWGAGYQPSGTPGRSLKGKDVVTVVTAPSKLFALSKSGKLYAVAASKDLQAQQLYKEEQSWWSSTFGSDPGVDFCELQAEGGLKSGEKWAGISAGTNHLLAVTTKGRAFSLPINPAGNKHRQLGTREVLSVEAAPLAVAPPEANPRYRKTLTEIPSLVGIQIAQVAAASRSSFVRTPTGRVLGFGANEAGQIGLGANAAVETVPTPVEVVLARNYPGGTTLRCLDIKAGGTTTMFVVERDTPGKEGTWVDLLACGNGLSGALGNGLWTSASGVPVRVKTVSGLQEYSEKQGAFIPLRIHDVSISTSPAPHIFAVLDTANEAEDKGKKQGLYGKDVMVWGGSADYQLGNGKRSSLAVPQHLPPLITRPAAAEASRESGLSSGTLSPMPHHRLQLHQSKADAYDLEGKLIKRGVDCEEVVSAGYNASILYNKILKP